LLRHGLLDSTSKVSDSVNLEQGLRIYISKKVLSLSDIIVEGSVVRTTATFQWFPFLFAPGDPLFGGGVGRGVV
jgi:hypothetical protein